MARMLPRVFLVKQRTQPGTTNYAILAVALISLVL